MFVRKSKFRSIPFILGVVSYLVMATSSAFATESLLARLKGMDDLKTSFSELRSDEQNLQAALAAHADCRLERVRAYSEVKTCLDRALEVQRAASGSRRAIKDIMTLAALPELQPLPASFAPQLAPLAHNFELLGQLDDRLQMESDRFNREEMWKFAPPTCDSILRNAAPVRKDTIVVDLQVSICKAVSLSRIRTSRDALFDEHVSYGDDEGAHISPGETPPGGDREGSCIGHACTGDAPGTGGDGGEGEGHHAFNPDRYDGEKVRHWAESGASGNERPVPLSDDQIIQIEHDRFDKETAGPTFAEMNAASTSASAAAGDLDIIPNGHLYEVAASSAPARASAPVIVPLSPASANSSPFHSPGARLNLSKIKLDHAAPSKWQGKAAKQIGEAAISEGFKSLAKGDTPGAEQSATLAESMTDLALGLTPGVNWAKDVVEAVTGHNYVTGQDLSGFERSLAIFGAVTVGIGSETGAAIKAFERFAVIARKVGAIDHAFIGAEKLAGAAIRIGIRAKDEAREFIDFSRRAFANEVGAVGDVESIDKSAEGIQRLLERLKITNINQLWTSTKDKTVIQNMERHYLDHAAEFGLHELEYVEATHNFIDSVPTGTLKKLRGTDRLYYHPPTNTYVSTTAAGVPRTMFKPDEGMTYWLKQSGKDIP